MASEQNSAPECISDTEHWLNWTSNFNNPKDSEVNCVADIESNMERDSGIKDPVYPAQQDVSATPNVPGLIRPTQKSKRLAKQVLMTINSIETRRNKGVKIM